MSATETSLNPGMTDDAVIEQRLDRAELLIARHLGIDAVQLPKPDLLHPELLAGSLSASLRSHSGRPSISHTLGPGRWNPALVAIGMPR